jgi:isocitrate/isopropylmalate dehydrogenase
MAMILAGAAVLNYMNTPQAERISRAIYESAFEAVYHGKSTTDLGGSLSTTAFTDVVIEGVKSKLEVWSGLGS